MTGKQLKPWYKCTDAERQEIIDTIKDMEEFINYYRWSQYLTLKEIQENLTDEQN